MGESKKSEMGGNEEQGFNESELEDIMSEIESLEAEFQDESGNESHQAVQAPTQPAVKQKVQEDKPVPVVAIHSANKSEIPACQGHSKMEFKVEGQMGLDLNFLIEGHHIHLFVSEAEGFVIEMEGGARFNIPLHKVKKAS